MRIALQSVLLIIGAGFMVGSAEPADLAAMATEITTILTDITMVASTTPHKTTLSPTTLSQTTPPQTTPPQQITFKVKDSQGNDCILEEMRAKFNLTYNMTNEEGNEVVSHVLYELPQIATVDPDKSECGNTTAKAKMTLRFDQPIHRNKFVQIFTIVNNQSTLSHISLFLNHTDTIFPNSTQAGKLVEYRASLPKMTFAAEPGSAFKCRSDETFNLSRSSEVQFSNVKVQAAGVVNNSFGDENVCPKDKTTTPVATTPVATTPVVTTSMTPTPTPAHYDWVIKNDDNETCMIVNMNMTFQIAYNNTDRVVNHTNVELLHNASTTNSQCGNDTTRIAKLVLNFFEDWKLEMDFSYNSTSKMYENTLLLLNFSHDGHFEQPLDNRTGIIASTNKTGIEAPMNKSYKCSTKQTYKAGNVNFVLSHVQLQPFALFTDGKIGAAAECAVDEKFNNIVPIAVGCALAGLVIIVLIAYLIGRQRSSKTGYESV